MKMYETMLLESAREGNSSHFIEFFYQETFEVGKAAVVRCWEKHRETFSQQLASLKLCLSVEIDTEKVVLTFFWNEE